MTLYQETFGKPEEGIAVDAAVAGNPGLGQYRGINISTGKQLFLFKKLGYVTNNLAEFFAIIHAQKWSMENNVYISVYSDSITAITWFNKRDVQTSLHIEKKTLIAHEMIIRALDFLKANKQKLRPVSKWETTIWGECPADFGRKN